jgi:phosphatidylglycerol lysyltransferase
MERAGTGGGERTAAQAAQLIRAYAREAVSPAILLPTITKQVVEDSVVGFVEVSGARVYAGLPVSREDAPGARLTALQLQSPRPNGRHELRTSLPIVIFGRELRDGEPLPPDAYVVGEQPWWDLPAWPETVLASRSLRAQIRRAHNKGVLVRECTPLELAAGTELRRCVENLIRAWLRARHLPPLGFVASVDPFFLLSERRVFLAELENSVVGALFSIPLAARQAWLLDHVVRARTAPNGTAEALVDTALRRFAADGARTATLGLCPLAGRVPRMLSLFLRGSRGLFDFHGLYAFKAKLKPQRWQRVVLQHPNQTALLGTLRALRAFAGGSLLLFGLRTALRGPPPFLRMIAFLLVPWTVALSLPGAERYFPSGEIRWAWVGFDLGVAIGLFWLALRISRRYSKRWLHRTLALLITADAVITSVQAISWNAKHARGWGDVLLISVACLAPWLATVTLWSALRFRES